MFYVCPSLFPKVLHQINLKEHSGLAEEIKISEDFAKPTVGSFDVDAGECCVVPPKGQGGSLWQG